MCDVSQSRLLSGFIDYFTQYTINFKPFTDGRAVLGQQRICTFHHVGRRARSTERSRAGRAGRRGSHRGVDARGRSPQTVAAIPRCAGAFWSRPGAAAPCRFMPRAIRASIPGAADNKDIEARVKRRRAPAKAVGEHPQFGRRGRGKAAVAGRAATPSGSKQQTVYGWDLCVWVHRRTCPRYEIVRARTRIYTE